MKLFIEIQDETVREYYKNWNTHHEGDSGMDIIFPQTTTIGPNEKKLIPLGIKCWSPDKTSYYMYPRSSIHKTPLLLANSVGIIDAGYTGEIKAPLLNHNNDYTPIYLTILLTIILSIPTLISIALILLAFYLRNTLYAQVIIQMLDNSFTIPQHSSYLQLCAPNLDPITIEIVDKLPETSRGEAGFGSTSQKKI